MAATLLTQAIGRHRTRVVTLRTAAGTAPTGFTLADDLECTIYAGDDQGPLATPTATWIDATEATVRVTYLAEDTAGLTPGTYLQDLDVISAGRRIQADRARLRLVAVPGEAEAPPAYCTAADVEALASGWLDDLLDLDADQAGFAEQRAEARRWLDRIVIARRRRDIDEWYRRHALWPSDATIEDDLATLQAYLDDDRLLIDAPIDGGMARTISAHYTLHLICRPELGSVGETSYQALAREHHAAAGRMLAAWGSRIDTSDPADGLADLVLGP